MDHRAEKRRSFHRNTGDVKKIKIELHPVGITEQEKEGSYIETLFCHILFCRDHPR